jgi:hypothetical protein
VPNTLLARWFLLPAFVATGCIHLPDGDVEPAFDTAPSSDSEPVVRRDVTVGWQGGEETTPAGPPLAASPLDRPPPDPVPFRIGAGHGALGRIDLAPCRAKGLPSGYLRMRVTFRRDGRVVHAVVESPAPPPQEALDCVAEQLHVAEVPVFDGRDAALTRRFFVEPGAPEAEPDDVIVRKSQPARHEAAEAAGLSQR